MFVKPGTRQDDRDRQLVVRGPNGAILSALGGTVPDTQFWHRRLRDRDVVEAQPIPLEKAVRGIGSQGEPLRAPGAEPPPMGRTCREASAALTATGAVVDDAVVPGATITATIGGEPLRLTGAEWARVPTIEPASGPAVEGFSTAEAIHDRDPAAPLLTHEEFLAMESTP